MELNQTNKNLYLVQCSVCGSKTPQKIYVDNEKGILLECIICGHESKQYHRQHFLKNKQIPKISL